MGNFIKGSEIMNFKKTMALACALGTMAVMSACGGKDKEDDMTETQTQTPTGTTMTTTVEMTEEGNNIITTVESMVKDAVSEVSRAVSDVMPEMTTENR